MLELIVCVLALAVGPLLFALFRRVPTLFSALDGFNLVAISGLVLFEILPHGLELAGWPAWPAALLGFAAPTLVERVRTRLGRHVHEGALVVAMAGLLLHGFLDGAALVQHGDEASALPLAVLLHRVPVGLAIWWLLRPEHGRAPAIGVLAALGVSTVCGFFFSGRLVGAIGGDAVGIFEGLMGGTLLHVVVHTSHPVELHATRGRFAAGVGALAAVVFLAQFVVGQHDHIHVPVESERSAEAEQPPSEVQRAGDSEGDLADSAPSPGSDFRRSLTRREAHVGHDHAPGEPCDDEGAADEHAHGGASPFDTFLDLARRSAPALLLGYLGAGLLTAFLPGASVRWLGRGRPASQALRGMLVGLPIPVCSCGVVPVYRSLVLRGAPIGAASALLVAAPELALESIILSIPLLGTKITVARVLAAAVIAFSVGCFLGSRQRATDPQPSVDEAPSETEPPAPISARVKRTITVGFGELVDHTGPWVLLGLVIAAYAGVFLEPAMFSSWPAGLDVPLFALIGLPLYVCAAGATPLVAVLIAGGVSPGAGLALLLTGPATNISTFGVLRQLHGPKTAFLFGGVVMFLAIAIGLVVNGVLGPIDLVPGAEHEHAAPWEWACLALLTLVFVSSLLRTGPRRFLAQILDLSTEERSSTDDDGAPHPAHPA